MSLPSAAVGEEPTNRKDGSRLPDGNPSLGSRGGARGAGQNAQGALADNENDDGDEIPELSNTSTPNHPRPVEAQQEGFKKGAWTSNNALLPSPPQQQPPPQQEDNRFSQNVKRLKHAIEQIMLAKIDQRRRAETNFSWDMKMLVIYTIFLIVFTVSVMDNTDPVDQHVRSEILYQLRISGSFRGSDDTQLYTVNSVDDIYAYLRTVLVPTVSLYNMTQLDPRCTPEGLSIVRQCSIARNTCCTTPQPNSRYFITSGNVLMTPVTIRQLRVRKKTLNTINGIGTIGYPKYSSWDDQTANGGGTWIDEDPLDQLIDWPSSEPWAKYKSCVSTGEDGCFVDDEAALYAGSYTRNGFVAALNGSTTDMLETLDALNAYDFIDVQMTRVIFVEFVSLVTSKSLFCFVTLTFEITEFGAVLASAVVRLNDLDQSVEYAYFVIQWIVYGYALVILVLIDVFLMYREGLDFFSNGWHYVGFLNYAIFIYSLVFVVRNQLREAPIKSTPILPMSAAAQSFPWHWAGKQHDLYTFVQAFNVLLSWVRFIQYLEQISPGTKQLTVTLSRSASQMSTLLILFLIIWMGYAIAFTMAFGSHLEAYSSLGKCFMTMFQIAIGNFDYNSLREVNSVLAPIIFITYIVLIFFLMLNMIMAIVIQTYETVFEELRGQERSEVTGTKILRQRARRLKVLLTAKRIEDIEGLRLGLDRESSRKFAAGDEALDVEDVFDGDYLTEHEFKLLFKGDEEALRRMGVETFGELMYYADVDGANKLGLDEVRDHSNKLKALEDKEAAKLAARAQHQPPAPATGDKDRESRKSTAASRRTRRPQEEEDEMMRERLEKIVRDAMDRSMKSLQVFVHNQISNATLVLAGIQSPDAVPAPPNRQKGGGPPPPSAAPPPPPAGGGGTVLRGSAALLPLPLP